MRPLWPQTAEVFRKRPVYMGIPCLIFRERTERGEGLKKTAVMAEFRTDLVRKFLDSYQRLFRRRIGV